MKTVSNLANSSSDVNSGKELDIQKKSLNKITHVEKGKILRSMVDKDTETLGKRLSFPKLP